MGEVGREERREGEDFFVLVWCGLVFLVLFWTGFLVGFVVVLFLKLALAREQAVFNIDT